MGRSGDRASRMRLFPIFRRGRVSSAVSVGCASGAANRAKAISIFVRAIGGHAAGAAA